MAQAVGPFAVISKSITGLRPCSTDATSNPRRLISRATVSTSAGTGHQLAEPVEGRASQRELLQEAQIVFVEQADVLDAPLQQRERARCPCRTRSRCSARDRSRPPRTRPGAPCRCRGSRSSRCACTSRSPLPPHGRAADVDLGARLGVGEEARAEAQLAFRRRTTRAANANSVPFRSASVTPSPTTRPFDLREHRRVREVEVVAAVDAARRDQADRRLVLSPCSGSACPRCACAAASPASPAGGPAPGRRGRACPACRARDDPAAC